MNDRPFEYRGILEVLDRHSVRFVVIGGLAGVLHGAPLVTEDVDICYERLEDNLERLAAALHELGARLRGAPPDVRFLLDAKTLKAGDHFTFTTQLGDLDILGTPAGSDGFGELDGTAKSADLGGLVVRVAALDDLIRMKRAAGRPKDLRAVEELGALRDLIDAEES